MRGKMLLGVFGEMCERVDVLGEIVEERGH